MLGRFSLQGNLTPVVVVVVGGVYATTPGLILTLKHQNLTLALNHTDYENTIFYTQWSSPIPQHILSISNSLTVVPLDLFEHAHLQVSRVKK